MRKNPYEIVKNIHVTEKTRMLQELKNSDSNPSARRCQSPKYVFIVNKNATKPEIARAVEEIYNEKNIKVVSVNTITIKGKERRVRGRTGRTSTTKKAVVTLEVGDSLDDV